MALFPSGATIKGRVIASFPATVTGTGGISVTKENGHYTISVDQDTFPDSFPAVRWDLEQFLGDEQRQQARENIAAVGYDAQTLADEQQDQALTNLAAGDVGWTGQHTFNAANTLFGTSTPNIVGSNNPRVQVHGTAGNSYLSSFRWSNDVGGAAVLLSKSRGATIGTRAIVQNSDILGVLQATGDDGTAFIPAADILFSVNGTPGTNDMPGQISFRTTSDGASSPTTRMTINAAGVVNFVSSPTMPQPAFNNYLSQTPWNDQSSVAGSAADFFNPQYFGNPGTGKIHRFNRIFAGVAATASGDLPPTNPSWFGAFHSSDIANAQVASISATGGHAFLGVTRTSDFRAWAGSSTGGAQAVNGFGINDDLTPGATPIAVGVYAELQHMPGCNGISLNQFDTTNRGTVVIDANASSSVTSGSQWGLGLTSGVFGGVGHVTGALYLGGTGPTGPRLRRGILALRQSLDETLGAGGGGIFTEGMSGMVHRWIGDEAAVTISVASPGVVTWAAHGRVAGAAVVFRTSGQTGAMPTGLSQGVTYYVHTVLDPNTFTVTASRGGAAINTTVAGVGTINAHTVLSDIWADTAGFHSLNAFVAPNGTSAIPTYSFFGDSDTGFSAPAANNIFAITGGVTRWRLYETGNMALGGADGTRRLNVISDDSANAAVTTVSRFMHTTTGTPGNGIGVGVEFVAETSSNNNEVGATIEAVATDVTAASEDFDLVFRTMAGGAAATEALRVKSTGQLRVAAGAVVANGAVATAMSSVGPTGANAAIQGWLALDVNGTTRYIPYW